MVAWNKGKKGLQHHTDEVKKRIGEASRKVALEQIANGTRKGLFQRGHETFVGQGHGNPNGSNKGNHYKRLGEKNPNWKHGKFMGQIKKLRISKTFLTSVFVSFPYQNELGKKLDVHHIDFNKKNNSPNNLISLCNSCHGQTGFNRDSWINYYNNVMSQRGISQ